MTDIEALTLRVQQIADARRDALQTSLRAYVKSELIKLVGPDYDPLDLRELAICIVNNNPWPSSARSALIKRVVEDLNIASQGV